MPNQINKTPWHVDKLPETSPREFKGRPSQEDVLAKPHGIERKGAKFKVFLDTHGKRVHIGYYKTLEAAQEALEDAKRDAGVD